MEQRISLITLGVKDLARARAFYEELGWQTNAEAVADIVFFQAGGAIVALWDRGKLAEDTAVTDGGGWGGITLAHCVGSPEACRHGHGQGGCRGGEHRSPCRSNLLGWLLRRLRRPRRAPVGGGAQPALDAA